MKLRKLKGLFRGDIVPSFPFLFFLITISSLLGLLGICQGFFGANTKRETAETLKRIIDTIDSKSVAVIPSGTYLFIHSCPTFIAEFENYREIKIKDFKLDNETLKRIKNRCSREGGVVCIARKMGKKSFFRICGYTLYEPELSEPIAQYIEKEKKLKVEEGSSESFVRVVIS